MTEWDRKSDLQLLSVVARANVWADPYLRYTSIFSGTLSSHPNDELWYTHDHCKSIIHLLAPFHRQKSSGWPSPRETTVAPSPVWPLTQWRFTVCPPFFAPSMSTAWSIPSSTCDSLARYSSWSLSLPPLSLSPSTPAPLTATTAMAVIPTPPPTIMAVIPTPPTSIMAVIPTPPTTIMAVIPTPPTIMAVIPTPPTSIMAVIPTPPTSIMAVIPTPPTIMAVIPTPPTSIIAVIPTPPTIMAVIPTPPTIMAVIPTPPTIIMAVIPTPPTIMAVIPTPPTIIMAVMSSLPLPPSWLSSLPLPPSSWLSCHPYPSHHHGCHPYPSHHHGCHPYPSHHHHGCHVIPTPPTSIMAVIPTPPTIMAVIPTPPTIMAVILTPPTITIAVIPTPPTIIIAVMSSLPLPPSSWLSCHPYPSHHHHGCHVIPTPPTIIMAVMSSLPLPPSSWLSCHPYPSHHHPGCHVIPTPPTTILAVMSSLSLPPPSWLSSLPLPPSSWLSCHPYPFHHHHRCHPYPSHHHHGCHPYPSHHHHGCHPYPSHHHHGCHPVGKEWLGEIANFICSFSVWQHTIITTVSAFPCETCSTALNRCKYKNTEHVHIIRHPKQHVSEQSRTAVWADPYRPWDTLACCWDIIQPTTITTINHCCHRFYHHNKMLSSVHSVVSTPSGAWGGDKGPPSGSVSCCFGWRLKGQSPAVQRPVSWRPTTVRWRQSNRHSTIGTRQTEYHEALPSSVNVQSHLTSSFADDDNASWYSVCLVPIVEWRLDCRHSTVVGLHDTGPRSLLTVRLHVPFGRPLLLSPRECPPCHCSEKTVQRHVADVFQPSPALRLGRFHFSHPWPPRWPGG